jgi:hypothetical protein
MARKRTQSATLEMVRGAQHAGSVPDAAFRRPDTAAEGYRSRQSLVIWGMSAYNPPTPDAGCHLSC